MEWNDGPGAAAAAAAAAAAKNEASMQRSRHGFPAINSKYSRNYGGRNLSSVWHRVFGLQASDVDEVK